MLRPGRTDNLVTIVCKHLEMVRAIPGLATLSLMSSTPTGRWCATEYAPSDPKIYNNTLYGAMQIP